MKVYVNGDSHAAAAEAVNQHAFAEDDSRYFYMGRVPHPENFKVSWARRLSESLKLPLYCDAESASSNARILRTTREWINANLDSVADTLMIIQWSTWEREEWILDGKNYQVTASGTDDVPSDYRDRYRQWIIDLNYQTCTENAHREIWDFHNELLALGCRHIFINGNNCFDKILPAQQHDWGNCYIGAYDPKLTYNSWLRNNGFATVSPDSWHFGSDGHAAWHRSVLQYIIKNKLV